MNKKKYIFSNRGFTLVEIIVAIAIAGIISLIALKLFSFGNDTLNKTEDRSYNQMSVRNASIAITDRIRYAKELQLVKDIDIPSGHTDPSIAGDGYDYIYFDKSDSSLKIIYEEGGTKKERKYLDSKLSPDPSKSYFRLELIPPVVPPNPPQEIEQLTFEITGKGDKYKDDTKDYKIKTTVNLVNSDIEAFAPKPKVPGDTLDRNVKYRAIRYK